MIIKYRHLFLLIVLISVTSASAFLFIDNKITGTAVYEPLDIAEFVKNIAKKSLEQNKDDFKDQFGEVVADALESAVGNAVDSTFENVFGGGTNLIGDYSERIGIKKVYKDRIVDNIIYVEIEDKKGEGGKKNKKIKCEIICEGDPGWDELQKG